jgi:DNA-binding protein HU-beta
MRKIDIINAVSERTGLHKVDVITSFDAIIHEIVASMSSGHNIYIRGFGSFVIKKRKAKIGRDIRKNQSIEIPEKLVAAFKASPELNNSLDHEMLLKVIGAQLHSEGKLVS